MPDKFLEMRNVGLRFDGQKKVMFRGVVASERVLVREAWNSFDF